MIINFVPENEQEYSRRSQQEFATVVLRLGIAFLGRVRHSVANYQPRGASVWVEQRVRRRGRQGGKSRCDQQASRSLQGELAQEAAL
jgi:hypothetical protein